MLISLRFSLTKSEEALVDEVLGHVKRLEGCGEGFALECLSISYLNGSSRGKQFSPSAGKRKRRQISVYPKLLEMIYLALNAARERAACADDSAALVEICEVFKNEQFQFGGPGEDFGTDLVRGGPFSRGESPTTTGRKESGGSRHA